MGLHYYFAVERRVDRPLPARWVPCMEVRDSSTSSSIPAPSYRATMTWLHQRSPALSLFTEGLFQMQPGPPPDAEHSILFAHHARLGNDEWLASVRWISAVDLALDEWPELSFILEGQAPARCAPAFADGRRPLPRAALTAEGLDARAIEEIEWRSRLCDTPIDQRFGAAAHRHHSVAPDFPVAVTWSTSLRELLGEPRFAAFQRLRDLGPAEDLRVIAYRA